MGVDSNCSISEKHMIISAKLSSGDGISTAITYHLTTNVKEQEVLNGNSKK